MASDSTTGRFHQKRIYLVLEQSPRPSHDEKTYFLYKLLLTLEHGSRGIVKEVVDPSPGQLRAGDFPIVIYKIKDAAKNIPPEPLGCDPKSGSPEQPWIAALCVGEISLPAFERARHAAEDKKRVVFNHPFQTKLSEIPQLRNAQITCDWVHEELKKMRAEGCQLYKPVGK